MLKQKHTNVKIVSATLVISSTGGAAHIMGEILGQYEYNEENGQYVQKSTEQSNEHYHERYIYYVDEHDVWMAGLPPGDETFGPSWIMSKELLNGDWIYYDGATWQSDPSLTVTPGPLPPLPSQFTLTDTNTSAEVVVGPSYLGVYNKTDRWWDGRPVYVNSQGRFLHHGIRWVIGSKLGVYTMSGNQSHHSPACIRSWTYVTDNLIDEEPAPVKIVSGAGGTVMEEDCRTTEEYRKNNILKPIQEKRQHRTSQNNSGAIISGTVLSLLGMCCTAMCLACQYANCEKNASTQPAPPAFEQPNQPTPSLDPAQDQTATVTKMSRPTPYSESQSWNTSSSHPTPSSPQ